MPRLAAVVQLPADETEEYSTVTVEAVGPEMWTAKISRTELSPGGEPETISALVNVGSISHLIAAAKQKEAEAAEDVSG